MRQEDYRTRDIATAKFLMHQERQEKAQDDQGNSRQDDKIKCILQRTDKKVIVEQPVVILQADPLGLADNAPLGKAGVNAHDRWHKQEYDEQNQIWRQKSVGDQVILDAVPTRCGAFVTVQHGSAHHPRSTAKTSSGGN